MSETELRYKRLVITARQAIKKELDDLASFVETELSEFELNAMSETLAYLALDMASFFAYPLRKVLRDMLDVLSGKPEAFRRYGALYTKAPKKLSNKESLLHRYYFIVDSTEKPIAGDFLRYLPTSVANQIMLTKPPQEVVSGE